MEIVRMRYEKDKQIQKLDKTKIQIRKKNIADEYRNNVKKYRN